MALTMREGTLSTHREIRGGSEEEIVNATLFHAETKESKDFAHRGK